MVSSCDKNTNQIIDPATEIYVEEFFKEANLRGLNLDREDYNLMVSFEDLPEGAVGRCLSSSRKRIALDIDYWQSANACVRKLLIFHELGHCILNREHLNHKNRQGICQSMMHDPEIAQCQQIYTSDIWRDYYLDELFGIDPVDNLWAESPIPATIGDKTVVFSEELEVDEENNPFDVTTFADIGADYTIVADILEFGETVDSTYGLVVNGNLFNFCECQSSAIQITDTAIGNNCHESFAKERLLTTVNKIQLDVNRGIASLFINDVYIHRISGSKFSLPDLTLKVKSKGSRSLLTIYSE